MKLLLTVFVLALVGCNPDHLGTLTTQEKPITCNGAFGYTFGSQLPDDGAVDRSARGLQTSIVVTTNFPPVTALAFVAFDGQILKITGMGRNSSDYSEMSSALEQKYGVGTVFRKDTNSWAETWTNATCEIKVWEDDKPNQSGIDFTDIPLQQKWTDQLEKDKDQEASKLTKGL